MEPVEDGDLSEQMDAKMKTKFGKIEKRNEERAENISKALEAKHEKGEEKTNILVTDFYKHLNDQVCLIEDGLKRAKDVDKSLIPAHLDETYRNLGNLQKYVTDAVVFLPSYDVGKAQNIVKDLNTRFQNTQNEVQPKKKFGFKGAKQKKAAVKSEVQDVQPVQTKHNLQSGVSIRGKKGEKNLELSEEETAEGDVTLADLDDCHVIIHGAPSTLHMSNINNCKIFAGPVSSSIFIDGCQDSEFALSCQQLRIHSTTNTHFYIHVTSKAIIEDSSQVRFGAHPGLDLIPDSSWKKAALQKSINNWDKVGDFNWLASDKPSPNWSKMEETPQTWRSMEQFFTS